MAVIVGRQKMTVVHAEGEHTIFPSADPQSLPDNLLYHPHVQGGVESGWITVMIDTKTPCEVCGRPTGGCCTVMVGPGTLDVPTADVPQVTHSPWITGRGEELDPLVENPGLGVFGESEFGGPQAAPIKRRRK